MKRFWLKLAWMILLLITTQIIISTFALTVVLAGIAILAMAFGASVELPNMGWAFASAVLTALILPVWAESDRQLKRLMKSKEVISGVRFFRYPAENIALLRIPGESGLQSVYLTQIQETEECVTLIDDHKIYEGKWYKYH